jgi:hypothetical protein
MDLESILAEGDWMDVDEVSHNIEQDVVMEHTEFPQ